MRLDALRRLFGIGGAAQDELDVLLRGELVQPCDERGEGFFRLVFNKLEEVVYIKMGYIVVAGVHAADKALEEFVSADVVRRRVYETGLIGNVIGELALLLDNDDVAVPLVNSLADKIDQLLRLSGSFQTQDQLNHFGHAPFQFFNNGCSRFL